MCAPGHMTAAEAYCTACLGSCSPAPSCAGRRRSATRKDRHIRLASPTAVVTLCLAHLVGPCIASDTWDVQARLFRDPNCFESAQELLLLDGGCYANLYSNATKAYAVKIVGFNSPQIIDMREYSDDCNNPATPKRLIQVGRCEKFAGNFWVQFKIRFRALTCSGDDCSQLVTGIQTFFEGFDCTGNMYSTFEYPFQRECMRFMNGTQTFAIDRSFTNVTMIDYSGNDKCDGGFVRTYAVTIGRCYPLRTASAPRSFSWAANAGARAALMSSSAPSRFGDVGLRVVVAIGWMLVAFATF